MRALWRRFKRFRVRKEVRALRRAIEMIDETTGQMDTRYEGATIGGMDLAAEMIETTIEEIEG